MTQFPAPIESFIPHDGDMSLLDRIISHEADETVAEVLINPKSVFFQPELGVPSWVGIEYMGQAIAAHAGLKARAQGLPVKIGFLVSTRRYTPTVKYFTSDSCVRIRVRPVTEGEEGLQVFECTIEGEGYHFSANLNVYMPENADDFLRENK